MTDKFKSRQEIAGEYGIDRKTLNRMLERHQLYPPPGLLSPEWVSKVYEALGRPEKKPPLN